MEIWLKERNRKDGIEVFCPYEKGKVVHGLAMVGGHPGKLIGEFWFDESKRTHIEIYEEYLIKIDGKYLIRVNGK